MKESLVIPVSETVEPPWVEAAGDPGFGMGPVCCFEDIRRLELSDRGTFSYFDQRRELGQQVEVQMKLKWRSVE